MEEVFLLLIFEKKILIESGGGTGPMKPGNQHDSFACMVPIPAVKTGR
ncbi:MAG: hypothetical protein H6Q58_2282 [Firmicutes bacterium]|nr:hypothetical protein [Bacillota bacterium]